MKRLFPSILLVCTGLFSSCQPPTSRTSKPEDLIQALEHNQPERALELLQEGSHPALINHYGQSTPMLALEGAQNPWIAHKALQLGASPHHLDHQKRDLLWYTIRYNEPSLANTLLTQYQVSPNQITPQGDSYLAFALHEGRYAIAHQLLAAGADPNITDRQGTSVLALASQNGLASFCEKIIPHTQSQPGEYLLHSAVQSGNSALLELLLVHHYDPNELNNFGFTPLHLASQNGRPHLTQLLLKYGANPNKQTTAGWHPLHLAAHQGCSQSIECLIASNAHLHAHHQNQSPLDVALASRQFSAAKTLLFHRSHPREWLLIASQKGDLPLAQFLISQGVYPGDIHVPNLDTPLAAAVRQGNYSLVNLYLRAGAPREALGYDRASPLHLAVAAIDLPMTQLLLDHGADPNLQFSQPAHPDFLQHIKSNGVARWFLRNDRRITPLMMAADSSSIELVRILLKANADTKAYTRKHRLRPYSFAVRRSDTPMIKLMFGRDPYRDERRVVVDLSKQQLTVFDESSQIIFKTHVSTGKKGHRTRTGEFVISNKYRHWESTIYRGSKMPFFQRLSGSDFGFHYGVCPGYPASHGCIRVPYHKASQLFKITQVGDRVNIVH